METVKILKEFNKGSQTIQIVEDDSKEKYIQIMDEMKVNTPVWQGDSYQTEELIAILIKAVEAI